MLFRSEFGSPVYLNVMAINIPRYDGDFWLFFCDSKKRFCRIAKEFMEAYDLDVTIMRKGKKIVATGRKGYNAKAFFKKAVKTHDARRAFLKFLLYAGKTEWDNFDDDVKNRISGFSVVKEEQLNPKDVVLSRIAGYEEKYIISTKCRFDLPDDFDDKIVPRVEGCFIIDKPLICQKMFPPLKYNPLYTNYCGLYRKIAPAYPSISPISMFLSTHIQAIISKT